MGAVLLMALPPIASSDTDASEEHRTALKARLDAVSAALDKVVSVSGRELHHASATTYVQNVLARVDPEAGRTFSVMILNDHDVSAWIGSLPVIHLTTGMLTLLDNEAQLALILAHEVEHYRADHAVTDVLGKLEEFRKGITLSYRLAAIFKTGARSIQHEKEADRAAIQAYLRAGYDPAAATRIFYRYHALEKANAGERDAGYQSGLTRLLASAATHPDLEQRRKIVVEAIEVYDGVTGVRVGRDEYLRGIQGVGLPELARSTLLRDDGRLRVYLGDAAAIKRYPDRIYYYSAEAFRLGGSDEERGRILPYYLKAIVDDPDFAEAYRAIARYKWRHGDRKSARLYYERYLERLDGNPVPDYLGQDLGLLEAVPLSRPFDHANCENNVFASEDGYFSVGMPCGWHISEKLPYSIRASRDGWSLNQIFVYSVGYDSALAPISETVSEPTDDKLDLLEMSRAAILKDDDDYSVPAGTGFEEINGRRWGWYEYTWRNDEGLRYRARRYETIVGKRIVGLAYIAPELHYFDDGLEAFGRTLGSLRIVNEPSAPDT